MHFIIAYSQRNKLIFYDIQSIKQGDSYFMAVTINKLVSQILLPYISALWMEFLNRSDWLHLV